ncbi:MAG: hypothetical protein ABEI07_00475 [Candidatus Nanohaloarchaea archaeon]
MAESWKDKTVSLGNVEKEKFDSDLSHIEVSENRIRVEFKEVEDWKRIQREIGEEKILKEVEWDEVEGVGKEKDHLYYPHIDVETEEGEKRLYFLDDEGELLESCISVIERFWNAYRQRGPKSRDSFSYREEGIEDSDEEAELEREEGSDGDDESEDEDGSGEERDSVEDLVEDFIGG